MARQASSISSDSSTTTRGFHTDVHPFDIRRSSFGILSAWVQHFIRTEFNSLATLGDTPLPKLLSGELEVNPIAHP